MFATLTKLLRNEDGATAIEYAMVASLVSVVAFFCISSIGNSVSAHFESVARFASPRSMAPMPVLGVPGWHPDTENEAFYDLASYFRSKPRNP